MPATSPRRPTTSTADCRSRDTFYPTRGVRMIAKSTDTHSPSAEEVLADAPPVRHEPGARERIRSAHAAAGRRIAVLDDDPTGSQTVHDVSVVTVFETDEYAAGLAAPGSTCFILTNTRS